MMQAINAVALLTILYRNIAAAAALTLPEANIQFGTFLWFSYAGISFLLVVFAGICSGLTLALMPLSQVELEVLRRSGSPAEKKQAGRPHPLCLHTFLFFFSIQHLMNYHYACIYLYFHM